MHRALAAIFFAALMAAAHAQQNGIHVNGYGVLRVAPDTVTFTFGIEGQTDTPAAAMERADSISGELVRRLERIGIESTDISSTPVTLNPFVDRQAQRQLIRFDRTTSAVLRDLDDFEAVYQAALESGVNSIGSVVYSVSNRDELQNQARDLALEDARAQAEGIAAKMGVGVGRILSIGASQPRPIPVFRSEQLALGVTADGNPEYRSGLIEIAQDVSVSFEIIQP